MVEVRSLRHENPDIFLCRSTRSQLATSYVKKQGRRVQDWYPFHALRVVHLLSFALIRGLHRVIMVALLRSFLIWFEGLPLAHAFVKARQLHLPAGTTCSQDGLMVVLGVERFDFVAIRDLLLSEPWQEPLIDNL